MEKKTALRKSKTTIKFFGIDLTVQEANQVLQINRKISLTIKQNGFLKK